MFRLLRRAAARIDRSAGLSVERTLLYRIPKAEGWGAIGSDAWRPGWELLKPECAGRLTDIGPFDVSAGLLRLQRGDRCHTVSIDGHLAHYSWVQTSGSHAITEAGVAVPVESGHLWIYDCRTAEWARGRGIYTATLVRIVREHFDSGYHTAWIYASRRNTASQKGIVRSGFRLAATLTALRVGSRYWSVGRRYQGQ